MSVYMRLPTVDRGGIPNMKAQTALGIFIAFGVVLLVLMLSPKTSFAASCGDGLCEPSEYPWCEDDCGYCGDGRCLGYDPTECPQDCGGGTCTPPCTGSQICQSGVCVSDGGTDTGVATGVGDVSTCSGTTGCTGATCRWSKCATTADPTKIEFTFTIPNTCIGNSRYDSSRRKYVPAKPCATNAVSFPDSVKDAYANNCLHSILLTQVQSDDYGKVCAGAGCSSSSASATGIISGPGGGAGGGGGNSFVSGTPVLLADGSSKPIEEISIGDKVRSFDPETSRFATGNVTSILTRDVQESYIIDFDDGSSVGVTGTHPFYVKTAAFGVPTVHKYFVQVKDLMADDRVYKAANDQAVPVKITAIRQISKSVTVYNFNVEMFHTYIANNMMVHNIKPQPAVLAKPTFSVTGFTTGAGGVIYTAASNGVWSPNIDATNAFDSANPQVSLYVEDKIAASGGGASRTIGATFKVIILNPSPTQKCVMDTATGKPKIVVLCAGTTVECTQTPTEIPTLTAPRCIDVTSQARWYSTGNSTSKCVDSNQYKAMVTPQQYLVPICTKNVTDPTFSKYGNYKTNATQPGDPPGGGPRTRNNWTTRTSCGTLGCDTATGQCRTGGGGGCPAGQTLCSDGVCRTSCVGGGTCIKPPSLTSITAAPRYVAPTGIVTMTSIGSSTESIVTNGTPRQMKVKLECGTATGDFNTTAPRPGGNNTNPPPGGGSCDAPAGSASYTAKVIAAIDAYLAAYPNIASKSGNDDEAVFTYLEGVAEKFRTQNPGFSASGNVINCNGNRGNDGLIVGSSTDSYGQYYDLINGVVAGNGGTIAESSWASFVELANWRRCNCGRTTPTGSATARPTFSVTGASTGAGGCQSVTQSGVLSILQPHSPDNTGIMEALPELQQAFGSQVQVLYHPIRLDKVDFGGGMVVDVINGATGQPASVSGATWGWIVETPCGGTGNTGSTSVSCQTGTFSANLCSGQLTDSNPTCTFTVPPEWRGGGHFQNLYCRLKDESGLYSNSSRTSIIVDNTPPVSQITAPAANSAQTANFQISVTDSDDSGLDKCYYTTSTTSSSTVLPRANIALSNPYKVWRPLDVAYSTRSDVALAVWNDNTVTKGAVGQLIKGDGTLIGSNFILGTNNDFSGGIKVAYDEDDDLFLVVWGTGVGNSMGPTYGSLVRPDGTFVKQNFVIMNDCNVGIHASSSGNIAYSKNAKTFYVTCTHGIITTGSIVGNSVTPDGTVGNEVVVTGGGMFGSSVAASGSTELVTWFDSNDIAYGRLYDSNGAALTDPIRISTGTLGGYVALVPFYDTTRNEYTVFYWGSVDKKLYKRTIGPSGTLGTESTVFTNNNVGVSDIAYNPLTGSYFVADQHINDNGNGYIEISSSGTAAASVRVSEDTTLPHYTPAIIATKSNVPLTIMNRAGDAYAQFGGLNGAINGAKLRTCNSQTTITVGPGNDCPNQGACTVSAFATDITGNVGTPDSRSFTIKLILTNITSPPDNSNQTGNFSVDVQDRDFASTTNSTLTCTYDVYSIGSTSTKTVNNAARRCNSNFTVTVGPGGNCTNMGQGSCKVVAKIDKTMNGTRVEDTSERFYNIDWVTPFSEIVSAPTNWVTSDFTISVRDNAQGVASRISKCQYRVVSNVTQTVPWTDRTCGINAPVSIPITVGPGKNCRHEGGDACTIIVRPLDMSGAPGIEDNVSVPVLFNATPDGFSSTITTQTERGLNFSGTTRQELRAYTFYVCNKNSNVNSCIAAYNSNNKGVNKPNFCGSLLGKCDVRCSDQTASYYFAARGTPVGQSTTVTVVSSIMSAACPTFNIGTINEWYQIFTQLEVEIGTEIGIIDSCINQNGVSNLCNNETLAILREALLITQDHLKYMNVTMRDLTVTTAQQLIQRSIEKRDELSALLGRIRPPTLVTTTVIMPDVVRFNRSMDLIALINKNGPTDVFGTVYCTITKPGNVVQQNKSSCLALVGSGQRMATYTVPFMPDRMGTWSYSCKLGRSVRPDCSFEVNQTPVSDTFVVLPVASTFIHSLSAPDNVIRSSVATTDVVVTNPDSMARFVNVTCSFKYMANGQLITRVNSSGCINAVAGDTTVPVNMYASTLGEWNVSSCTVYSSSSSNCASQSRDNVSLDTASYMVILPSTVFIESVSVPQTPVLNNSLVSIPAVINNPTNDVAYVTLNCGMTKPQNGGSLIVTDQNGVDSGRTSSFTLDTTTDRVGMWNISSCSVSVSPVPDFSNSAVVFTRNNVGAFNVIARTNLTITDVSPQGTVQNNTFTSISVSITNPSNTRYGRVSCIVRDPINRAHVNNSACLLVTSNAQRVFAVNFFANRTGEWHIPQCSVYGSAYSDCSQASLHDTKTFVGKSFNSTITCTNGLYSATNPTTGICQEFGNNCNIPAGWINITAGSCPAGPGVVYISSVTVPTSDVVNNSNVNIDTLVANPVNDDRFGKVSCTVRSPSGATQLLTSSCQGIPAINTRTYRITLPVNTVGIWNVTRCSVNASTDCASATLQHTFNASKTINVIRGINLSFVSFSLPPDAVVNSVVQLQAAMRNPSDAARYARVFCSFRNPNNLDASNTTACLQVAGTSTSTFGVNIHTNIVGTWNVQTCTLRGSLDSSCAELHDTESNIGAFNITAVSPPPALAELFISNISASSAAQNDSRVSVLVYGRNSNLANSSYAHVGCDFLNPLGGLTRQTSSCMQVTANSTVRFGVSQLLNILGTWTVRNCFINASNTNNCAPSALNNVSTESRSITVSLPPNLYITGVNAPDADVVNNTNVNIDIFVNNPLNDDKYGFVSCIIENPAGINQTKTTPCSFVQRANNKRYNVSLFAGVVGSWNVRNCSVRSSASASCASSSVAGELINGDTFNVIRGYNLTLSSLSVPQSVYVNLPLYVAYTLRNPSTSDRYARVTCTMTKGGQSVVNTSSCMTIGPESFIDNNAVFTPASTGTWSVTCVAERSFDAGCTSLEAHDRDSENFNVTTPPDLFIQSIDVPSLAPKDYEVFTTLRIRNPAITNAYGFVQCTFKNRLNETTYNNSDCLNMTSDTTTVSMGITPALRGNWSVYNCYVNATPLTDCSSSRVHNISTTEKSFNVFAPVLSFVGSINLASSNLMVGDIADIVVNVKNTGEREYLTFVNCTLINPLGVSYMLTTTPQTLQIDETRDFHPQRQVDVSGTWKVGICGAYSISSPPKLEASKTVNHNFDVLYAASTDECSSSVPCQVGFTCESGKCVAAQPLCTASNCPGTKQGCYCSNDQCVSCGQGYTCSRASCVPETPVINTCRSTNDCTSGNICVNGVCQQKPVECYSNSDCGVNYVCSSGSCVVSVQKPLLDEKIIYFLIILLAVLMVPIILFIYIKRAI